MSVSVSLKLTLTHTLTHPHPTLMSTMKSFPIAELAQIISAKVIGDDQAIISQIAPISRAKSGELTFLTSNAYRRYLRETKASAVILSQENCVDCPTTALIVDNPEYAFARIAQLFNPIQKPAAGIHATALIAKSASVDSSASIGAYCVIGENVVIGPKTVLHSGVIIHDDVVIGSDCLFYSHVTLYHRVSLGNRVILHSGVVIGADGFGLAHHQGRFEKIPQLGSVVIADDVEVGANTCIDRGALDNTIIETGVKIDNLVQIAHNVVIGAHSVIAGCSGIAGSTTIGRHCMVGGYTAIGGHLTICDGAIFTGSSMVTKSVKEPGIYSSGTGLLPNADWRKAVVRFRQGIKRDTK